MAGNAKTGVGLSGCRTRVVVIKELSPDHDCESAIKFAVEIAKTNLLTLMALTGAPFKVPGHLEISPGMDRYSRDFIRGRTLEEKLCQSGRLRFIDVIERITAIVKSLQYGPLLSAGVLGDAICYKTWIEGSYLTVDSGNEIRGAWEELIPDLNRCYPAVPMGFCHGDLAFDNIIVGEDGEWWLIDPLANAYETPWWDVGKVLQSTYCNWPLLRRGVVAEPDTGMRDIAEAVMGEERKTALFFLMLVLLRIIRHAPEQERKRAILTEALRVGREYVEAIR